METLAIVFAILTVAFVLDMMRLDYGILRGVRYESSRIDAGTILAVGSFFAAVVFGVLAAVL